VVAALVVGMALATADGGTDEVVATHACAEPHTVYNLTVDVLHTYFVVVAGEPILVHNDTSNWTPVGVFVNENGVKIEIYSNDHGPPHAQVWEGSGDKKMNETTIGQDGKPLAGDPPLT
jgi:hypothetical protein